MSDSLKRNPERVLETLSKHSNTPDYKFERLYRNLFNERMFHVAYQRIYANQGNMTPGTDGKTIDQMSLQRIGRVIESLRNETYQPHPARRVYIPKKNGKLRPLGIPSFEDKLVQEVVRMVLEAIYDVVLVLLIVFGYRHWGLFGTGVALSLSYLFDILLVGGYAWLRFHYRMSGAVVRYMSIQFALGLAVYMVTLVDNPFIYWSLGILLCVTSLLISVMILHQKTKLWASLVGKLKSRFHRHEA